MKSILYYGLGLQEVTCLTVAELYEMVDNSGDGWNPIFDSLLRLYQKLKDLGFTYSEGKVTIVDTEKEDSNV